MVSVFCSYGDPVVIRSTKVRMAIRQEDRPCDVVTDRTLSPVVLPVVGHTSVVKNVVVISKLLASVHQEPSELREGEFEHFVRVLIRLWVIFVPNPAHRLSIILYLLTPWCCGTFLHHHLN